MFQTQLDRSPKVHFLGRRCIASLARASDRTAAQR